MKIFPQPRFWLKKIKCLLDFADDWPVVRNTALIADVENTRNYPDWLKF